MPNLTTPELAFTSRAGETVLDAALRQGLTLPFSCRGGTCQTCVMRCLEGEIPARAQRGLPVSLTTHGYFMPCVCEPTGDMVLGPSRPSDFVTGCRIEAIDTDAQGRTLRLEPERELMARMGQWWRFSPHAPGADGGGDLESGTGVVVALPSQHYFLDLRLPPATADGPALAPDGWLWLKPAPPADPTGDSTEDRGLRPARDEALWRELEDGRRARAILDDFYAHVYADERLAPFFKGVTREHVAGKQYSFLCKLMTGEPVYFGDEPRNAHHWMVIPDELFDHRQRLMEDALRRQGLNEDQIERWTRFELFYRRDIVKAAPVPKVLWGQAMALDGFGEETLTVGSVCDHCGTEIAPGTRVRYHLRLGTVSCPACSG